MRFRRDTHAWAVLRLDDGRPLSRLATRRLARHLSRCEMCADPEDPDDPVVGALAAASTSGVADMSPPDDLLATLLAQADDPGLRARAAVPVRGAVSGARPGLTVLLVVGVVAMVGGAAWAGWEIGRRLRHDRP